MQSCFVFWLLFVCFRKKCSLWQSVKKIKSEKEYRWDRKWWVGSQLPELPKRQGQIHGDFPSGLLEGHLGCFFLLLAGLVGFYLMTPPSRLAQISSLYSLPWAPPHTECLTFHQFSLLWHTDHGVYGWLLKFHCRAGQSTGGDWSCVFPGSSSSSNNNSYYHHQWDLIIVDVAMVRMFVSLQNSYAEILIPKAMVLEVRPLGGD